MSDTVVVGSGTAGGLCRWPGTRAQPAGPPAAGTTFHADGSSYQSADGFNQLVWAGLTPVQTTGRLASGWTSDESAISYTFQVVSSDSPL